MKSSQQKDEKHSDMSKPKVAFTKDKVLFILLDLLIIGLLIYINIHNYTKHSYHIGWVGEGL